MWKDTVRPFTVFCLWAFAVACANLNERPAATSAGGELSKAAASVAPEQKRAAPVPRQRMIIKDRPLVVQEPAHRTFDREREEQYEEEEQQRGRYRHREE